MTQDPKMEFEKGMDMQLVAALIGGLVGAIVGSISSFLASLRILDRQQARQRRYEKWIRVLNAYQDFSTEGRKYLAFRTQGREEMANEALLSMYKCAYDADLLDPNGQERARRMLALINSLPPTGQPLPADLDTNFSSTAYGIYRDFERDSVTAKWASTSDMA